MSTETEKKEIILCNSTLEADLSLWGGEKSGGTTACTTASKQTNTFVKFKMRPVC